MWNNEEEVNEMGESVKLYLPVQAPPRRSNTAISSSHIGGHTHFEEDAPTCAKCESPMFLLVHLKVPNIMKQDDSIVDRFVSVYGCPRAACFNTLKFENGFASGGQGIICCQSRVTPVIMEEPKPSAPVAPVKSSWYSDDGDNDDNDWGIDAGSSDQGMADLESAVAAMESNLEDGALAKSKKASSGKPIKDKTGNGNKSSDFFGCYLLKEQDEPIATQKLEEDDVGLSASDEKIRNMLARYMAEEEDEEILAALRGTNMGGGVGEEDERLTQEERCLLGFQDRVRRVPRQVVRRARGGIPIWSAPSEKKNKPLFSTPKCGCGAEKTFEFQLLPSLLHTLEVDRYAGDDQASDGKQGIGAMLASGMNWGTIAVYTCPEYCCQGEEGIVIQESVDERPDIPDEKKPQEDAFQPTMAVVEDMDDDAEFQPDA